MNTSSSAGIEAALVAVFSEIFAPVAAERIMQLKASTATTAAEPTRLVIHAQVQGEEPAVKSPSGKTASLVEVNLNLHVSAADYDEQWLNETIRAFEARRNAIESLVPSLTSLAPFACLEIYEFGAQPLGFDNAKWMKQFTATVCALLN